MSFMDLFRRTDINEGVEQYKKEASAVLLDVRTKEEYKEGHIEGSINVPLQTIGNAKQHIKDISTPIYTYCLSGARSRQAAAALESMGYKKVINIGGIGGYRGKIVR